MSLIPISSTNDPAQTAEQSATSTAFVRPDNPPPGIAGYIFHIVDEDKAEIAADVTDYILEDKTFAQDHISLKPEIIRVTGLVAELPRKAPSLLGSSNTVIRPLEPLSDYTPQFATDATRKNDEADQHEGEKEKQAQKTPGLFAAFQNKRKFRPNSTSGLGESADKQMEAYEFFRWLWATKQLVTVETPWGIYDNMAVLSITVVQGATRYLSTFQMAFKQIRVVGESKTTGAMNAPGSATGRFENANMAMADHGTVSGAQMDINESAWGA